MKKLFKDLTKRQKQYNKKLLVPLEKVIFDVLKDHVKKR